MKAPKEGDKVSWKSSNGKAMGQVIAVNTRTFQRHGRKIKTSAEDPRYLVEAKKTRARASHTSEALKKR
jgi:hypothetical protein